MTATANTPAPKSGISIPGVLILLALALSVGAFLYGQFGAPKWAPPAAPTNQAESVLGPVAPDAMVGEQQGVSANYTPAGYVITNTTLPRGTYSAFGPLPGGAGDFRIVARVKLENAPSPDQGLGIIFARNPANGNYMAAAIMGDGSVAIYSKSSEGLNQTLNQKTEGMIKPGVNEIEARRENGEISIFVNGESVSSHSGGYVAASTDGGIFANGLGVYTFEKVTFQGRPPKT